MDLIKISSDRGPAGLLTYKVVIQYSNSIQVSQTLSLINWDVTEFLDFERLEFGPVSLKYNSKEAAFKLC